MRLVFCVLILSCVVLVACGPPASPVASNAPTNQQATQGASLTMLFDHDKVTSYDYRSTSYLSNQTLITRYFTTVSSDTKNGVAAWHITSWAEMEGAPLPAGTKGYTEVWFEKATEKCILAQNVVDVNGQKTITDGPCGPSITYGNPMGVGYPFIRTTEVKLPLGTFDVSMYGVEGAVIYFMNEDVPVPVMMTWGSGKPGPGTIYFELERYS